MYKSQLCEFARKSGWDNPRYGSSKKGQAHCLRFQAWVEVNGIRYESEPEPDQDGFRSIKAAEQSAAKNALAQVAGDDSSIEDMDGLCRNLLQQHAQKNGLPLPVYTVEQHCARFVASVSVDGVLYHGEAAKSKKEAEVKAAIVALESLESTGGASSPEANEEFVDPSLQGLSKSVLQEYAQKNGLPVPIYTSMQTNTPQFEATVTVGGFSYKGGAAKSKKEAEAKAAKAALASFRDPEDITGRKRVLMPSSPEEERLTKRCI